MGFYFLNYIKVCYYCNIKKERKEKLPDYYIGIGLCFGIAFGAAFDNIGLGICLGLVFGAAMQKLKKVRNKDR